MLTAYRAGWAAFEQALADANPEDPRLAATMVDPQLQSVKGNILADQRQGMVGHVCSSCTRRSRRCRRRPRRLQALLHASPGSLTPEQLLHQAWDESADPFTRTVYVTIARLKRDNRV